MKPSDQDKDPLSKLIIDRDEYEEAIRTARAQNLARRLGCKLPYALAKKYNCRCGKVFVRPQEFLIHRGECAVLIRDKELLDRKPKVEESKVIVAAKRKRQSFDCSCGVSFHSKGHLTKHRKLCFAYSDYLDRVERGKEYLERHGVVANKKQRKKKNSGNPKKASRNKTSKRVRVQRKVSRKD